MSNPRDSLYPVLPLRDIVVFPHMIVPLFVGREKSVRALEDVMKDDKQILLVAQKDAGMDDPTPDDIYRVGTIGTVLQLLKLPDGTVKVLVEGGARARITEFIDSDDFFHFVDRARDIGIEVPIIPGVLPVLSSKQIRRFTRLCGASIPADLEAHLVKYENDDESARAMGVEYATYQVQALWDAGVSGIHFYVLNRSYS